MCATTVEEGSSSFCGFSLHATQLWCFLLNRVAYGGTAPPVCFGTNWKTGTHSRQVHSVAGLLRYKPKTISAVRADNVISQVDDIGCMATCINLEVI